jgi:EAL domain-containing protein (putative c-di-GMP-specific phosphodiesterase class I)
MHRLAAERMQLETELRRGLAANEFFLEYQPQIEIAGGRIVGVEALLRWRHPQRGVLAPGAFLEVAEESGLIIPLGEWVLRNACRAAVRWHQGGGNGLRLAVNISMHQFKQANFIALVETILAESGLDPRLLEMEMTEGLVMENTEATLLTLADLKSLGIGLAVDDFGTGYSSLSYLKHFPFDRVKIAREFVRDIPDDSDSTAIVVAVLSMAASLGLGVIAEGVETRRQLLFLREHGCAEMQGHYVAPSLAESEVPAFFGRAGRLQGDWCPLP